MAKKASKVIDNDSGSVTINFEETGNAVAVQLSELTQDIITRLALHGLSQKLGDSYAGAEAEEAYDLAAQVAERLRAGEWTQARTGGGGPRVSQLVEALAAATGKDQEECLTVVSAMDDEQKKQLKKHPSVAAELARISAERAAQKAAAAAKAAEGAEIAPLPL